MAVFCTKRAVAALLTSAMMIVGSLSVGCGGSDGSEQTIGNDPGDGDSGAQSGDGAPGFLHGDGGSGDATTGGDGGRADSGPIVIGDGGLLLPDGAVAGDGCVPNICEAIGAGAC